MESPRGSDHLLPDSYGAAATPLYRPQVKFHLHRPFEDHVIRRPTDAPYLQYPDVHSTGLPLLLPPPAFQQHPLGAFQQLYQHQKMRAEAAVMSQAAKDEAELLRLRDRRHDDSRGEDDDRSRSPDSPTQLTGDEGAADDVDESTTSVNSHQTSSPAADKCESVLNISFTFPMHALLYSRLKKILCGRLSNIYNFIHQMRRCVYVDELVLVFKKIQPHGSVMTRTPPRGSVRVRTLPRESDRVKSTG